MRNLLNELKAKAAVAANIRPGGPSGWKRDVCADDAEKYARVYLKMVYSAARSDASVYQSRRPTDRPADDRR